MKKIVVVLGAVVLMGGTLQTQELKQSDVPAAVKSTFAKSFPKAHDVEWSKETETEFEAEFKNGSLKQSANFDASGKWVVTETEIKQSDLSAAAQAALKKEFAGYKVEEVEKVEMPDKVSFYEVKLEKGEQGVNVEISAEGKVLKKEVKKEEKD